MSVGGEIGQILLWWTPFCGTVDAAILTAAERLGINRAQLVQHRPARGLVPFSSDKKLMAGFHQVDGAVVAYAKGAPGHILALCTRLITAAGELPLDDEARAFMTLALGQIAHLPNARSAEAVLRPSRLATNPYALGGAAIAIGLQLATAWFEPLAGIMRVVPLASRDWAVVATMAALPAVVGQTLKAWRPRVTTAVAMAD